MATYELKEAGQVLFTGTGAECWHELGKRYGKDIKVGELMEKQVIIEPKE